MNKSYVFFALPLVVVMIAGAAVLSGLSLSVYWDLPSFVIVYLPAFALSLASHRPAGILGSFTVPFKAGSSRRELEAAALFFSAFQKYLALSAVFAVFLGTIAVLSCFDDLAVVGKAFAVTLLAGFYATLGILLVALPYRAGIERRLRESGEKTVDPA